MEDFVQFMELRPEEVAAREQVTERLRQLLVKNLKHFDPDVSPACTARSLAMCCAWHECERCYERKVRPSCVTR